MKTINFLIIITLAFIVWGCNSKGKVIEEEAINSEIEKYEPNWESLARHKADPQWFADSKLGIYFHWGLYSVPAYKSEWYPYHMYRDNEVKSYHIKNYGKLSEFNYHDFIPMFTGENFDPEEWADLFQQAGARFAGPVAQHHDGFAMWDSQINPWNAGEMGPKRDILGDLFKSLKSRNLKTIATFHHARNLQRHSKDSSDWGGEQSHFAYHPNYATSSTDPKLAKLYGNIPKDEFHEYWLDQVNEVVDKYSPDILWYDTWLNLIPEDYRQKMAAHYFNHALKTNQDVLIAYKQYNIDMPANIGVLDIEQGGKKDLSNEVWLTDITLSFKSWSYIKGQKYKDAKMVVRNMIDVWSKNGVVLLNISPMANGTIPQEQRRVLGEIGDWMKKYSEAIYGTVPYYIYGYGNAKVDDGAYGGQTATVQYSAKDTRFTMAKDQKAIYVFVLGKPKVGEKIQLRKLGKAHFPPPGKVKKIIELGSNQEVKWNEYSVGYKFIVPDVPLSEIANVFKIELE